MKVNRCRSQSVSQSYQADLKFPNPIPGLTNGPALADVTFRNEFLDQHRPSKQEARCCRRGRREEEEQAVCPSVSHQRVGVHTTRFRSHGVCQAKCGEARQLPHRRESLLHRHALRRVRAAVLARSSLCDPSHQCQKRVAKISQHRLRPSPAKGVSTNMYLT